MGFQNVPGVVETLVPDRGSSGLPQFNVRSYGAVGNGVSNDQVAIAAAVNAACAAGGGIVYFPAGTYLMSTTGLPNGELPVSCDNTFLVGAGRDVSKILCGVNGQPFVHFTGTQSVDGATIVPVNNVGMRDLTIDCNQKNATGLGIRWVQGLLIQRCRVTNNLEGRLVSTAVQNNLTENYNIVFEDCLFDNFVNNSHIEATMFADMRHLRLVRCEWNTGQYMYCSLYQQVIDAEFDTCWFHDGAPATAKGGACDGIGYRKGDHNLRIHDCRFENLWQGHALTDIGGPGQDNYGFTAAHGLVFSDNWVNNCANGLQLVGGTGFEIRDNHFELLDGAAMIIGSTTAPLRGSIVNNVMRNCGRGGGGAASQCGIYIQPSAANTLDAAVLVQGNTFADSQPTATMTNGVVVDIKAARTLYGYTFVDNDFTRVATGFTTVSGVLDPGLALRSNRGYNPRSGGTLTFPGSGLAAQNKNNVDNVFILSAGTGVTALTAGVAPAPLDAPVVVEVSGGGAGFPTGAVAFTPEYRNAAGDTNLGTASAFVSIAAATDTLAVSAVAAPTVAPTLVAGTGHDAFPAGTYTVGYTWVTDVGETPLGPTSSVVITAGQKITVSAISVPAAGGPSSTILAARFYFTGASPLLGRCQEIGISATGTPNIGGFDMNSVPYAIGAPTVSPSLQVTDMTAPTAITPPTGTGAITGGTLPAGTYTYAFTLVDASGETSLSLTSAAATVASGTTGSIAVASFSGVNVNATSANVYIVAPLAQDGLSITVAITTPGTVPAFTIIAPGVAKDTEIAQGTWQLALSYVTPAGHETLIGPSSTGVLLAAGQQPEVSGATADSNILLDTGIADSLGQIAVYKVRVYAVGTSPVTGLIQEMVMQLPATAGNPPYIPSFTFVSGTVYTPVLPPTVDASVPPASPGKAGFRVPPQGTPTTMRFWLNSGANYWRTDQTVSAGVVAPFLMTAPGTADNAGGALVTATSANTTGTSVYTQTSGALTGPVTVRLPAGEAMTAVYATAPAVNGIGEFSSASGTPVAGGTGTVTSVSSPGGTITVGSPTTTPTLDVAPALGTTGTSQQIYAATTGQDLTPAVGTAGTPDTTLNPAIKATRLLSVLQGAVGLIGSGEEQLSAIQGVATGDASTQVQPVGVFGGAKNSGTSGSHPDAAGLIGVGRILATGTGTGIGVFAEGRTDSTAGASFAHGAELDASNYSPGGHNVNPNGLSSSIGVLINSSGNQQAGAGIELNNGFGTQFDVGLHFTGFVNTLTGPVHTASYQDDGAALTSVLINGTHSTAAIAVKAGSGPTLLGGVTGNSGNAATLLEVQGANAAADPLIYAGNTGFQQSYSMRLRNNTSQTVLAVVGGNNQIVSGSVLGETVLGNAAAALRTLITGGLGRGIVMSAVGVVSGVNFVAFSNAATTTAPIIAAAGTDTNVGLTVSAKGTSVITATSPANLPNFDMYQQFYH